MDKIKILIMWLHWRLTGYRELSKLIRWAAFGAPLTQIGIDRANELAFKEAHLRRLLSGIEHL